ncbi:hypothetical protein [Aminipila terrae]|uniref:Uncharacterized protein n=1 Tax=Aminipila terrae TaxID=2697030 RepID=A0A6P1MAP3_9FIRM|nr:hypothetical protein [Aminipila terrae]QHI71749.1 hypothetical protein Ami3637_04530 [Aminipila terrae]
MEKDVKRYMRAVVIIMITAFCAMKLPHQDKAIFHLIMPTIKLGPGTRLYLNGILPLALLLWSYKEIVKSKYFQCSKFLIFIIMFFILVPFTFNAMNVIKVPYYLLSGGLKSIDVVESDYSFSNEPNGNTIEVNIILKNYGKEVKDFNVSIDFPKSLEKIIDKDPILLPQKYTIDKKQGILRIEESIPFNYKKGFSAEDLFDSHYFYDDYKVILSKGDQELAIVQRGE